MSIPVQKHYQSYPYPKYPLLASVRRCDVYAHNIDAIWCRFNGRLPPASAKKILVAGCGTFAPYPWALANPDSEITALDLSERSLWRARLHCIIHLRGNVVYRCANLLDNDESASGFGMIDSYGVIHHLDDPLAGLRALERRLLPEGILRIMVYSRYARKEEESIRRALRFLGVNEIKTARSLLMKAKTGSRLANFLTDSEEISTDAGFADALLHPKVHTFRIDTLLDMVGQTGLVPLMFAHAGARYDVQDEICRLRHLEKKRCSPGNFVLYLGRNMAGRIEHHENNMIALNPCLRSAVSIFRQGTLHIPSRTGTDNPVLGYAERRFLRRFVIPVRRSDVPLNSAETLDLYKRAFFLLEYVP